MDFYDRLAAYYDDIFPAAKATLQFLCDNLPQPPGPLLDIACGSGNYTLAMADKGYQVTGTDLSKTMIDAAQKKALGREDMQFLQGDMRLLNGVEGNYKGAYCLGNSFVHLLTEKDMRQTLSAIHDRLAIAGQLVLQTVNYDRILKFHVTQLPPITNEAAKLTFSRYYDFRQDGLIDFRTVLEVPDGQYTNTVTLKPLLVGKLRNLLSDAGFRLDGVYGAFDGRMHEAEAPATVVVAEKLR